MPVFNRFLCHQLVAISAPFLGYFCLGNLLGLTTILIPALQTDQSDFIIDNKQASWIASARSLAAILGSLVTTQVMTAQGRRVAHVMNFLMTAISHVILFTAYSYPPCAVASLLQGFTYGGSVILHPVIIAECSSPVYRGIFNSVLILFAEMGIMFAHVLGTYLNWRTVTLLLEIPVVLCLVTTPFWKETPYWLASQGRFDDCEDSFHWYRGYDKEAIEELNSLQVKERHRIAVQHPTSILVTINTILKTFTQKDFLRPFGVILAAASFFDLSGKGVVVAYTIQILAELGIVGNNAYLIIIAIDCCCLLGLLASIVCSKLLLRRHHLFYSVGLSIACLALASCCHRLRVEGWLPEYWRWASAAMLCGFMFASAVGMTSVPIALIGELFPVRYQGVALPLVGIYISLAQFATAISGLSMLYALGVDGLMGVYGGLCLTFLVILYFIQPETQNKNLTEIERLYSRDKTRSAPSLSIQPAPSTPLYSEGQ